MNLQETQQNLAHVMLLQALTAAELDYLLPFVKVCQFPVNTLLIEQGKAGNGMYIIKQGRVQITVRLPGNIENKIAVLSEQDFFGDVALIDQGVTTASVVTLSKTDCYFLSCDFFNMLQLSAPVIAHKICASINKGVAARLAYIYQQLAGRLVDIKKPASIAGRQKFTHAAAVTFSELKHHNINVDFLKTLGVFNYFNHSELKELFTYMTFHQVPRDYLLFNEKQPAKALYLVAQGAVQITVVKNHKVTKLNVIGPGGIFGLLSYFNKTAHSATAATREDTAVLEFKYINMNLLQQKNPLLFYKWYYVISQSLITLLRGADKDLIRLASRLN